MKINSKSQSDTKTIAKKFSLIMKLPLIVGLEGDLGVGKTEFVRSFIQIFNAKERVKSPTFGLLEEYEFKDITIVHADLYRIKENESNYIDFNEYYNDKCIILIEWIGNDKKLLSYADVLINISLRKNNIDRQFLISGKSNKGNQVISDLKYQIE